MENKLIIPLGKNKIVATINKAGTDIPPELIVSIVDENNTFIQDICLVRPNYRFKPYEGSFIIDNDFVDCLVWGDSDDDDFIDDITIAVREVGE